jgi:hypothetical protein
MRNACVAFDLDLEFEHPPATSFALAMYISMVRRVMAIVPMFLDFADPPMHEMMIQLPACFEPTHASSRLNTASFCPTTRQTNDKSHAR